ncbi:B9 domain-containing protein 2 isoform X1 [Contarinia nasturtii]|uniref:B9 domain-containing protein 2 isoform X1 n=1 Tax=Contarinia nasturtii TaxID=265458 RepID=UPI0012D456EC|nr:B9 domain-containing protein 2 isoform X1 [Contarinia nasturtii]
MAELHLIGQILSACDFEEPTLFCKWSIQYGSNWKHIEGYLEGQTATCTNKFENTYCAFAHPIDVHLACRGIQGWPKIHIEIYTVNALNQCWPVGFGFAYIPSAPGLHSFDISTWKVTTKTYFDSLKTRFNTGGSTISKSDLVYSGVERYKLSTISAGKVTVELMIIAKNFSTFGVDLK